MLISPEKFLEDGLVSASDAKRPPSSSSERVDYHLVIEPKLLILEKSFEQFTANLKPNIVKPFLLFRG